MVVSPFSLTFIVFFYVHHTFANIRFVDVAVHDFTNQAYEKTAQIETSK